MARNKIFFIGALAAGAAFIVIGIAAGIYANVAVPVSIDGTIKPGHIDQLTPDMYSGNTASMQIKGSTFNVQIKAPDGAVVISKSGVSNFAYDLVATKEGVYRILVNNTGTQQDVQITGKAETKSSPLELSGALMLVITGIIVLGLGLRFRAH